MKLKISTRDVKFFILGVLIMFLITLIFEWKDFVKGFTEGYSHKANIENTK